MMLAVIAAAFTFTATATGVESGTPLEFMFAGNDSDRAYETMFLLDKSVAEFGSELEKAGLKRGRPVEQEECRLWPVGCRITLKPAIEEFVTVKMPEGMATPSFIYTGGTRTKGGEPEAEVEMPRSVLSFYSLSQSLVVPNGIYEQGEVYGCFQAKRKLEKGKRFEFTVSWDERTMAKPMEVVFKKGNAESVIRQIREAGKEGEIDLKVRFDSGMTVKEAADVAGAIAVFDSASVKVNGCGEIFYRAFLPMAKWLDRNERLMQPFEMTVGADKMTYIEEDWTVEGDDPKLTERVIRPEESEKYPKTSTCFLYAKPETRLSEVYKTKSKISSKNVRNWYVFMTDNTSSHNRSYTEK